jgi:hypothetical protein
LPFALLSWIALCTQIIVVMITITLRTQIIMMTVIGANNNHHNNRSTDVVDCSVYVELGFGPGSSLGLGFSLFTVCECVHGVV